MLLSGESCTVVVVVASRALLLSGESCTVQELMSSAASAHTAAGLSDHRAGMSNVDLDFMKFFIHSLKYYYPGLLG
jgi:hypothetical protein